MSKAPRLRTMYMPDADCWDWAQGYDWEPLADATSAPHRNKQQKIEQTATPANEGRETR